MPDAYLFLNNLQVYLYGKNGAGKSTHSGKLTESDYTVFNVDNTESLISLLADYAAIKIVCNPEY